MSRRVAIGNHKGGSGKTATAVNLAAALAEAGRRVLVVDLDPQANASRRLGASYDPAAPALTVSEVVKSGDEGVAEQAIRPCGWPTPYPDHISVIPSRKDLENRGATEAGNLGSVLRLASAMQGADDDYDVTLIDCQPSLSHLVQLALATVHYALAVTDPEFDGLDGALTYRDYVRNAQNRRALHNPDLGFLGVVVTRVRPLSSHRFQVDNLDDTLGEGVGWTPHVPERAAIKEGGEFGLPLRGLPASADTRAMSGIYDALAARLVKEIL